MKNKESKKLIIIDGNALLHRAYHAIRELTDPKGRPVNALYGFAKILGNVIEKMDPTYLTVCWDRREKTFRHEAYKEYKGTRKAKPQDLYDQIDYIKDMLDLYQIPYYDKVGYEADDLLGTIAKKYKNKVDKVLILTGDLDALQLVEEKINVVTFKKGISDVIVYDEKAVRDRYDLNVDQLIDLKALMGDSSDNIKGVAGIGKLGATKLIKEFGSVENLYKKFEDSDIKDRTKELLRDGKKDALQSLDLVEIRLNVPIKLSLSDMKFGEYDRDALDQFFLEYGFRSFISKKDSTPVKLESSKSTSGKVDLKKLLEKVESSKELAFNIIEGVEGLFGKEIEEISLESNGLCVQSKGVKSADIIKELKPIFENKNIKKIGHGLKSQMHILSGFDIKLKGVEFDTMLAGYVLSPGKRRYEIDELLLDYLKRKPGSCSATDIYDLKKVLENEIEKEKLQYVLYDIEMLLVEVLFEMEHVGIKLDKDLLSGLSKDFTAQLEKIDKKIHKISGEDFNIDSPAQLQVVLYEKMKLKPAFGRIKRGKTGYSTAASELEKLLGTSPIIELIMEHRELAKLMNTYVEALPKLVAKDGRIHSSFNQTITSTGRLSSSAPNLQNIPIRSELGRKIRRAFVADRGNTLISLDYSQIELRLAAAITGEDHMIKSFNKGEDIHTRTASEVFGIPLDKIDKDMRRKAKAINFGVLYGMGAMGLSRAAKISRSEAEDFLEKYYAAHPAIMKYIETTKALAYKQGYAETIFGRRRYLPELQSYMPQLKASGERMAINMPLQGTAADIMKLAMIKVYDEVVSEDVKMILQVHDELVFEVPESQAEKLAEKIKEIMETTYKLKVPLDVDVEIDKRWR